MKIIKIKIENEKRQNQNGFFFSELSLKTYFTDFVFLFSNIISKPLNLPLYIDNREFSLEDFPEVIVALRGENTKVLRQDKNGNLFLSVAIPIKNIRMIRGAVLLSVSGNKIEKELGGKANGHEDYLEGMGTQFSFDLNGKSYSVDLWDEDILNDVWV